MGRGARGTRRGYKEKLGGVLREEYQDYFRVSSIRSVRNPLQTTQKLILIFVGLVLFCRENDRRP